MPNNQRLGYKKLIHNLRTVIVIILFLFPSQLLKHDVDQCHLLTDCHSCVTSNDPLCGWCALSGTCVRSNGCGSVRDSNNALQRVYVPNAQEYLCPRIESSTPSIIHIEQLQVGNGGVYDEGFLFRISELLSIESMHNYTVELPNNR